MGRFAMINDLVKGHPRLEWIGRIGLPIDDLIEKELSSVDLNPPPFDPCLFDELLESASERLDVCLSRRRDIMDLLDRAIRQGLEDDLFKSLRTQDDLLDQASDQAAHCHAIEESASTAAAAYTAAHTGITDGLGASAAGSGDVARIDAAQDLIRQAALASKSKLQTDHHANLFKLSQEPGHPFNFEQRAKRVWTLLSADLKELIGKLSAVEKGLSGILGIVHPLPKLGGYEPKPDSKGAQWAPNNALDALVIWARESSVLLEKYLACEITSTLQIPLVSEFSPDGTMSCVSKIEGAAFHASFGNHADTGSGLNAFSIDGSWFPGLKNVRVLGIGASIHIPGQSRRVDLDPKLAGREVPTYESRSVRIVVDLPERTTGRDLFGPLSKLGAPEDTPKRSILLGSVTLSPPAHSSPAPIRNASPIGDWRIRVLRGVLWDHISDPGREAILDVRLSVKVAGVMVGS